MRNQNALILPIGEKDWNGGNCAKFAFMLEYLPALQKLGWTIGVDLKGGNIGWAGELAKALKQIGGVLSWHPSLYPTLKWGSEEFTLNETVKDWAEQARCAKEIFGLQVLNVHLGAPHYASPAPSDSHRFDAKMTAQEMVDCIKAHVPLLKEMNQLSGGILTIENLHMYLFNDEANADKYYVYNVMHVGAWYDLFWLAREAGVSTCVDIEHYFGSFNLLNRLEEFEEVILPPDSVAQFEKPSSITEIAGYELIKGFAPYVSYPTSLDRYIEVCKPELLHLGTVSEAVVNGLCGDHREFNLSNPEEKEILQWQLKYIERSNCLGGVIEACGQTEGGFNWTKEGRSPDPDQAKFNAFLSALEVLEEMHK